MLVRSGLITLLAFVCMALAPARSLAQGNPIQVENAKPGTTAWELPGTKPDALPTPSSAIRGYTSQISVAPGDPLELHVSTAPAAPYRVEIYRLGWYGGAGGRLIACIPASCTGSENGTAQPISTPDPNTGELDAGWPVTDSITVGSDWTSGYYVAKLILIAGSPVHANWVPFIVRAPAGQNSAVLVQASVNTWEAYNNWPGPSQGGKSLYGFNSSSAPVTESMNNAAVKVSFNRPFAGDQNTWPFMWEYNLVRYLERNGYDVSYQTDVDTDLNASSLLGHRLDIANGHDEYWSHNMRDAWEAARAAGVNLAFMGGNVSYWQARYELNDRTLIEYRDAAHDTSETDRALRTETFMSADVNRPECRLLGVAYGGEIGAGDPPHAYTVPTAALSNPWFSGTAFAAGDTLADTVGYEWNDIQPSCAVPGALTTVLQYDGLSTANGSKNPAQAVTYTDPSSGSRVFTASSMQLNWALDDFGHSPHANSHAQVLFANIFDDLAATPAPVLEAPAPGATADSPVRFSWSSSMGLSSYEVDVDGAPVQRVSASACSNGACAVSVHVDAGSHAWSVAGTDFGGATVASESQAFVVPAPSVAAVSPDLGPSSGLNTVHITGGGFTPQATVTFGGISAPSVTYVSSTTLDAVVPPGTSGPVDVRVLTDAGQSPLSSSDVYTYDSPPAIDALSTSSGSPAGGEVVTITGDDFVPGSTVDFGSSAAASVTFISSTQLRAMAPPGAGTVHVSVLTPYGRSASSSADTFTYSPPTLGSPRPGAVLWTPTPRLTWAWAGTGAYQVYIDGRLVATTASTSYVPSRALTDGGHSWSVVAVDGAGRRNPSAASTFVVSSARAGSASRLRVLGRGLVLHIFCTGRCSIWVQIRTRRRGPVLSATRQRHAGAGMNTLTLRLSRPLRRELAASRRAVLYLTVSARAGRVSRTVAFTVGWTAAGIR